MPGELTEAHIQDVAKVLQHRWTHNELHLVADRFDAEALRVGGSLVNRITNFLREENGTKLGLQVLQYLVNEPGSGGEYEHDLAKALQGSPFTLGRDEQNHPTLHLDLGMEAHAEVQAQISFIEKHAPPKVLEHLKSADDDLASGDTDGALGHARKALEAMSVSSFSSGLVELVKVGLIGGWDGNPPRRTLDREVLYSAYGYTSSLGSHTKAGEAKPSLIQAKFGVLHTYQAVHFLLDRLREAHRRGIALSEWTAIRDP